MDGNECRVNVTGALLDRVWAGGRFVIINVNLFTCLWKICVRSRK